MIRAFSTLSICHRLCLCTQGHGSNPTSRVLGVGYPDAALRYSGGSIDVGVPHRVEGYKRLDLVSRASDMGSGALIESGPRYGESKALLCSLQGPKRGPTRGKVRHLSSS